MDPCKQRFFLAGEAIDGFIAWLVAVEPGQVDVLRLASFF
jgi:hypothetical protein